MSIPRNEAFEGFLSKCSVHAKKSDGPSVVLSSENRRTKRNTPAKDYFLAYPDGGVSLDAVTRKIEESLSQNGVPGDRQVATTTLALIVETRPIGMSAVEHANRCLGNTQPARLMQSIVLPGQPRHDYEISLGTYRISPFNAEKILYWAHRCGSAFPINLRDLNGWAELSRGSMDLILLDWSQAILNGPILTRWGREIVSDEFLDYYYAAIAGAVAGTVKERIKADVLILESAGMLWVDIENLLSMMLLKIVSLFVWTHEGRTRGWATYSDQSILHANFPDEKGIAECRAWLQAELGFSELSERSHFDGAVRTYCRFLQRAHGHRLDGRRDEAFVHFVIALDLLLGSEGRSSDSVAVRAATLVHRQANLKPEEQTKRLKKLYGLRSKYVHEGRGISAADVREIETICTEILWALLYVSGKSKITDVDEWLRKVDFLAAGMNAGQTLPEADFLAVGISAEAQARKSPLRVLETREVFPFLEM